MAKRKLLQWMRDKLHSHAKEIVSPATEKKALDAAYERAAKHVKAIVTKKFPPAEMKMLMKWSCASAADDPKLSLPNGTVVQFKFSEDDAPLRPHGYEYGRQIYLADAVTAAAVEKWITANEAFKAESKKRIDAYRALALGASYVEDVIAVWPEAAKVLPAGSPLIPLGPEQIALVKADQRERKAA